MRRLVQAQPAIRPQHRCAAGRAIGVQHLRRDIVPQRRDRDHEAAVGQPDHLHVADLGPRHAVAPGQLRAADKADRPVLADPPGVEGGLAIAHRIQELALRRIELAEQDHIAGKPVHALQLRNGAKTAAGIEQRSQPHAVDQTRPEQRRLAPQLDQRDRRRAGIAGPA